MSKVKGGEILGRALKSLEVDTVFFLLGSPMHTVIWECFKLGIRLIDVRHEQAAAMMAHAYSRISGRTGVCVTGSGPDTANTVSGVVAAFDFCDPLVAIGGSTTMASREMGAFEEMDQVSLMRPVTKRAWQVQSADRVADFVGMAFRHATANKPGPVYLDFPEDILRAEVDEDQVKLPTLSKPSRPLGDEKLIEEAISILENAERPVIIAGSGALWSEAGPELQEFVEYTRIPFFTTPLAKGLIPEDHPLCFPAARSFAWKAADVALVIGTRTSFIIQHLLPPRFSKDLKVIMVNIDAEEIGHNRPVEVGIVGDAKAVLQQLLGQARGKFTSKPISQRSWHEKLAEVNTEENESVSSLLNSEEKPIHPLRLCKEVREFLQRDAILVTDGHCIMNFARQSIPLYYPRHHLNPGITACIGAGVPFGIGAKVAEPEKQVLVLSGDGSFGFNGMEMDTAVRHKIPVVVVLSNNGCHAGFPFLGPTGYELGFTRYDKMVEALGGKGYYVEEPGDIRPALESAFASGQPALVNVITSNVKATTQPFTTFVAEVARKGTS